MITDKSTSCRNVREIQETIMTGLCDVIADGRLTKATAAKRYAHHMVPTPLVTLRASHVLNRAAALPCGSWSVALPGPSTIRAVSDRSASPCEVPTHSRGAD